MNDKVTCFWVHCCLGRVSHTRTIWGTYFFIQRVLNYFRVLRREEKKMHLLKKNTLLECILFITFAGYDL